MKLEVKSLSFDKWETDLLVILLEKDLQLPLLENSELKSFVTALARDFEEKKIKREFFTRWNGKGIKHLLVFHSSLEPSYNSWERTKIFASRALGYGKDYSLKNISFLMNGDDASPYIGKVVEGAVLGSYNFDKYKKEKNEYPAEARITLISNETSLEADRERCKHYSQVMGILNECRDLVNEPGSVVYPEVLANLAKDLSKAHSLKVTVLDEKALEKGGYQGLISVGKGSIHPPRLITLEYKPAKKSGIRLALVGKGITFDTGGISLKPSEKMLEMKGDMAGAAAVLYTMKAIAYLKPAIEVIGIIPTAENFPDAKAQRPGDIFVAKNGKSVQVDNTDAEGRLVLIDAFARAGELKATHIVDVATLTGAVVRALGQGVAGIMGNSQVLIDAVIKSGANHGEHFWPLPLPEEYKEMLKTPYADINNIGGPNAGAITGGLFLQEFLPENTAWVHLDIAGPFMFDKPWKFYKEGATGFGMKTLVDLCWRFKEYFSN
jgi:leucyl aminopeptidase